MENLIADLSRQQIGAFFSNNAPLTQQECDEKAEAITGTSVTPSTVQGGHSYTVVGGASVVQFRLPSSILDLAFLRHVEQAYKGYVPRHTDAGKLGDLGVYTMGNMGGVSMYLARDQLHEQNCLRLEQTLKDYARSVETNVLSLQKPAADPVNARFFTMPWHNTPSGLRVPSRQSLLKEYSEQLEQLCQGLPQRFRPALDSLITELPGLLDEEWPLVPNHIDLLENNIHVDPATGAITGICDWKEAEVSPFGMSLGGLETMLGIRKMKEGWCYLANQKDLRRLFWDTFFSLMGDLSEKQKRQIEVARLIGLFLANGFDYDEGGNMTPAQEGHGELPYLEAIVLGN